MTELLNTRTENQNMAAISCSKFVFNLFTFGTQVACLKVGNGVALDRSWLVTSI